MMKGLATTTLLNGLASQPSKPVDLMDNCST